MTTRYRELLPCPGHCICYYSDYERCCMCGSREYADCAHCGEPIVRLPGGVWDHAVALDDDEDDGHVAEPAEEVFDEQGIALPRPDTSALRLFDETPSESRRREADWDLGPREPLRSTAQDVEISETFL